MKIKLRFLIVVLVLSSLTLSACGGAPTAAPTSAPVETESPPTPTIEPTPEETGPLVVLIDNDEGPITPANFNTFIGFYLLGWVYDSLYIRTPDLEPIPSLAPSATPSEDGLTWTITLREGVNWHDGEPFMVDDVIFSYNFLIAAGRANNLAEIESMEANGDYGLTIKLKSPQPFFLNEGL